MALAVHMKMSFKNAVHQITSVMLTKVIVTQTVNAKMTLYVAGIIVHLLFHHQLIAVKILDQVIHISLNQGKA